MGGWAGGWVGRTGASAGLVQTASAWSTPLPRKKAVEGVGWRRWVEEEEEEEEEEEVGGWEAAACSPQGRRCRRSTLMCMVECPGGRVERDWWVGGWVSV